MLAAGKTRLRQKHPEEKWKDARKAVYSLTKKGKTEFEKLMLGIAARPINIFLDFNAVILNLDSLSPQINRPASVSLRLTYKK